MTGGMKIGKDLTKQRGGTINNHPWRKECPHCGAYVMNVGITRLVYTFEACDCDAAPYPHLVETIYHKHCFGRMLFMMAEAKESGGQNANPASGRNDALAAGMQT